MNIFFLLSEIKVNVLIGSEYKILTELISNILMSLTEFNRINKVENTLHSGSMSYEGPWNEVDNRPTYYERYMTIGFKSEYNK